MPPNSPVICSFGPVFRPKVAPYNAPGPAPIVAPTRGRTNAFSGGATCASAAHGASKAAAKLIPISTFFIAVSSQKSRGRVSLA